MVRIRQAASSMEDLRPAPVGGAVCFQAGDEKVLFAERIAEMPSDWEEVTAGRNLFLERSYFQALEESPPEGATFGYLLFYQRHRPAGVAALQFVDFRTDQAIRHRRQSNGKGLSTRVKDALARRLHFRLMVCGNLLLTGEHGHYFREDLLSPPAATEWLLNSLHRLSRHLAGAGRPISATLIKDVAATSTTALSPFFSGQGFHLLRFEPNMVLELCPEWSTMEDYLESMTSKYRVRARRAFKKAALLLRRELHLPELPQFMPALYDYYRSLAEGADFNMTQLSPGYFLALKKHVPDRFRLYGYFLQEKLIGFCTTLRNGEELEAHFLGFDPDGNRAFQLYLNMLYDIVGEGLAGKARRIIFARTALEIKSSVGARPQDMHIYLKTENRFINFLAPYLVRLLEPRTDWTPRHPFGDGVGAADGE